MIIKNLVLTTSLTPYTSILRMGTVGSVTTVGAVHKSQLRSNAVHIIQIDGASTFQWVEPLYWYLNDLHAF